MLNNPKSVGFSEGSTLPNQEPFTSHHAYLLEPMEDGLAGVAPSVGLVELMGHESLSNSVLEH